MGTDVELTWAMSDASSLHAHSLQTAEERIRRFERFGGVVLGGLEPEAKDLLLPEVHIGTAFYKKAVFWFECPLCGHKVSNDQEMEPMCTGPSWTDDHEMMAMQRIAS